MKNTKVKKAALVTALFMFAAVACNLSVTMTPSTNPAPLPADTVIPATQVPTQIPASATAIPATAVPVPTFTQIPATPTSIPATAAPTALQPTPAGVRVSAGPLSAVLPRGLASSARGIQVPPNEGQDQAAWDKTPGHTILKLEGYRLQGKFHQPQIYVYPALEYAQLMPAAFESIHRLDNILYGPGGPAINDQLPAVPFFNAQQVFASQARLLSFQNGSGVRYLTEYAQYPASANNQDLFYHFEGVTRDGAYYIVAILPISSPSLAETSDAGAALPAGGVPYPFMANPEADMPAYYGAVTSLLDSASPESFNPNLNQLDALIQSIRVAP